MQYMFKKLMYMFGFDKSLEIYSLFLEDFKKFQKIY